MTTLTVTAETLAVAALGNRLGRLDAQSFGQGVLKAVNETMVRTDESAMGRMLSGVNITQQQVDKRKELRPATDAAQPVAHIIVRKSNATLASFGAREAPVAVNWSNARIRELGRTPVPREQVRGNPMNKGIWTLRTGVPSVGIPADLKRHGITVEVTKGAPKSLAHGFLIKRGTNMIAMKRSKNGAVSAARSLAPYQLFKHALSPDFLLSVADDMERALGESFDNTLRKVGL